MMPTISTAPFRLLVLFGLVYFIFFPESGLGFHNGFPHPEEQEEQSSAEENKLTGNDGRVLVEMKILQKAGMSSMSKEAFIRAKPVLSGVVVGQNLDIETFFKKLNRKQYSLSGAGLNMADISALSDSVFGQMDFADGWFPFLSITKGKQQRLFFGFIENKIITVKYLITVENEKVTGKYEFPDYNVDLLPKPPKVLLQYWVMLTDSERMEGRKLGTQFFHSLNSRENYPEVEKRLTLIQEGDPVIKVNTLLTIRFSDLSINGPVEQIEYGLMQVKKISKKNIPRFVLVVGYIANELKVCMKKILIENGQVIGLEECDSS